MIRKIILFPIAIFYRLIIQFRNFLYKKKIFKINQLPCLVISVGNITVGGTGKTPTVIYLSNFFKNKGYKTAIISRGYKRTTKGTVLVSDGIKIFKKWQETGDEPYMMAKKLENIPIVVDTNRYRGGKLLVKMFKPDIILMDDGFQHRKLYRNLDIILINGKDDANKHNLLPYGLLREPWDCIVRADIILTTKQKPSDDLSKKIKNTHLPVFNTEIKYSLILPNSNSADTFLNLKNKRVFLYSGIAEPNSFKKVVLDMQCIVCGTKFFPDHFPYSKNDIREIEFLAKMKNADLIITTEKDWVKTKEHEPEYDLAIVDLSIKIKEEKKFDQLLQSFSI